MSTPVLFAHVGLTVPVDSFDRVSDFYQDVFGWKREREYNGEYGRMQFLTDGQGSHIELVARTVVERAKKTPDPPGHICFAVPDEEFLAVLERARKAGAEVGEPQSSTPQGRHEIDPDTGELRTGGQVSHYIFFDDPCGNCIEVSSGAYRSLVG